MKNFLSPRVVISSLEDMRRYRDWISHVISVVDPEDKVFIPSMGIPSDRHLQLFCHDVASRAEAKARVREMPGSRCIAPTNALVQKALSFARPLGEGDSLLINCGYGISRSPAIAFAILCQAYPERSEDELLQTVLKIRPQSVPNQLIVQHADDLLGRSGRMIKALQRLSR